MIEIINKKYEGSQSTLAMNVNIPLQALFDYPQCPLSIHTIIEGITTWQERNETSLNSALRLWSDFTAVLLVLGSRVVTSKDEANQETTLLEDFLFKGLAGSSLVKLFIPLNVPNRFFGFSQVRRTPADVPIVAAYATVRLSDNMIEQARIALTGAGSMNTINQNVWLAKAASLLTGKALTDETIQETATTISQETEPQGNYLGSVEYRRAMVALTVKRALQECKKGERGI